MLLAQRQDSKAGAETAALSVRLEPPLTNWDAHEGADVILAITENGLSSSVTRGENAGSQLSHRAVVREMKVLGQVKSDGSFTADPDLKLGKELEAREFARGRISSGAPKPPYPGRGRSQSLRACERRIG